jgi:hypothetical protein
MTNNYQSPISIVVSTLPFQGSNNGSNPLWGTYNNNNEC